MKKLIYSILFLGIAGALNAQQLPQYTQYLLNGYVMNPAIGGSKPYFDGKLNHRSQWVGIEDAPRTYILSMHGPVADNKVGVGGYIFNDITGPTQRLGAQGSYSYHMNLTSDIKLSMGVFAGLLQFTIDGSKIVTETSGDPKLSGGIQRLLLPDAGAGLYLYADNFFFSLSSPQIIPWKLKFFDNVENIEGRLKNHLYASGGYRYQISNDFQIEPSFMVKYVYPVPPQFDISTRLIYQDNLWLGVSYRTYDAVGVMAGYELMESLMFAYSYDFTTSNIRNYSTGTHEIMLGVKFMRNTVLPSSEPQEE